MNAAWGHLPTNTIFAAASAFLITLIAVPIVIRVCRRTGLLDFPGALKLHSRPVPRLGGIALVLGIAAGAAFAARATGHAAIPFLCALAIICGVGVLDDVRGMPPWLRLAVQFVAAGILWGAGWRLPLAGSGAVNLIATCVFIAAFVNAFNFLDGADGLAAAIVAIIALNFALLSAGFTGSLGAALAWSAAAACAAFLIFNLPPARIFMGDSGSTSLGFIVAFLALDFYRAAGATNYGVPQNSPGTHPAFTAALLFPIFVSLLPLTDAALAIVRRLLGGGSPFAGDRRHFYDLLFRSGWSQGRVAAASAGVTAVFAVMARVALQMRPVGSSLLFAAGTGLLLAGALLLGSLRAEKIEEIQTSETATHPAVNSVGAPLRIAK